MGWQSPHGDGMGAGVTGPSKGTVSRPLQWEHRASGTQSLTTEGKRTELKRRKQGLRLGACCSRTLNSSCSVSLPLLPAPSRPLPPPDWLRAFSCPTLTALNARSRQLSSCSSVSWPLSCPVSTLSPSLFLRRLISPAQRPSSFSRTVAWPAPHALSRAGPS